MRVHRLIRPPAVALAALALCATGCGDGDRAKTPATLGAAKPAPVEIGRNVARVPGLSPADVSAAAVLSAFDGQQPPSGWVLVRQNSWREAALAAQFAATPVRAGILPIKSQYLPTGSADVLGRIKPSGFPKADGLEAVVLGHVSKDVFVDLEDLGLKPTQLEAATPERLAADLVPFRGGWAGRHSASVVVVSSEARDYALPAAAWSAYSGDTLAFVSRRGVPKHTAALLAQRQKLLLDKPSIYVIGPPGVVPDAVLDQLRPHGEVKRVPGRNAVETAVELARYKDPKTGFGWGLRRGQASVSLVNTRDWANAIGAFAFAAGGPQAPLLLTDDPSRLPRPVEHYLRELAGPSQGFAFGDAKSISPQVLGQMDELLRRRG
jgi:putative cell wall binding repeat protein